MREDKKSKKNELKSLKTLSDYHDFIGNLLLTEEERKICDMVFVEGRTYLWIGEDLGLSESTVKRRVSKILDKLL